MAKWGEGDPRWLVEHREDGKNVNGWHWSEVNRLEWSKQRLAGMLPGVEAAMPGGDAASWVARVTKVSSVSGEAMLTTRKGNKRFAFYDLKLTLDWTAESLPPAAAAGAPTAGEEADAAAPETHAEAQQGSGSALQPGEAAEGAAREAGSGDKAAAASAAVSAAGEAGAVSPAVTGTISVAEFASGSDHDDIEVTVTANGGGSADLQQLKRHVEKTLWAQVLQRLEQFVVELGDV